MTDIFARNFDFEIEEETAQLEEATAAPAQSTVTLVQAEMMAEQAKKAGYDEGMIAGAARALSEERSSRTALCDEALVVLSHSFMDLAARDARLRAEVELEMAELITGIGERLLPDLFEGHIADALVARINSALRFASGEGQVSIRVPPELTEELTPRLEALVQSVDHEGVQFRVLTDTQIDDGTIRMNWRNGFLEYDPALASAEALNTLKEAIVELRTQLESMP